MAIDVSVLVTGAKEAAMRFARLSDETQKRLVVDVTRSSANRVKGKLLQNITGKIVKVRRGAFLKAMKMKKIVLIRNSRQIGAGLRLPTRFQLRIAKDARWYFPAVLEYGSAKRNIPAYAPMRKTMNEQSAREVLNIGRELGRAIEKAAGR